jgi:lipopolysaccharide/colanic/teichoic acid biosynthesis glycosyltransferase
MKEKVKELSKAYEELHEEAKHSLTGLEKLIEKIENTNDWRFLISGIVITDKNMKDEKIGEYSVISDVGNMFTDIESMDIDSVLIAQDQEPDEKIISWMKEFRRLGKIIHMQIDEFEVGYSYKGLDRIGYLPVMSYHDIAPMPKRQVLLRRIFSIITALLGLPLLFAVSLITWIFDKIESPGKLFVTRVRVGVNNRRYYQYRFRYYRMDAQERIQEGKSPYTFIGKILRKTHLDGLPMLVNIISGDMDLIGPKAPSLPRYLGMSAEERNQLSIRPGAIGYWSSDRKKDKIAQAQEEYVLNWNIGKDLVIIVVTALRYISGRSLRRDGETHIQEELDFIRDLNEEYQPYPYDHSLYHKEASGSYVFYLVIKRIFDIIISILAIIIASPLLLILTIHVIADDGGSPLYGHRRIGMNGKMITIYKFRSMMEDAGDLRKLLSAEQLEQYKTEFKVDNDPRITSIGNFIRKTSLDELPQLFNILEGSMSLVGPRPIVDEEALIYGDQIGKFLSVKPGLTGYWQAYARNNATYESGERQKMEMYYVDNCSLWLDIKILFRTVGAVLTREGAQ